MSLFGNGGTSPETANGSDLIKDSTDAGFVADVVEASKTTPVIVDFWAPWCGPCRQLGPTIERVVKAAKGAVKLVKINIDENPAIAGQLRVQSIPAVFAFKDGQPVDGFMGAQPESQIRAFVDRLSGETDAGEEADAMVARGKDALNIGDTGGAAQDFAGALQIDPQNTGALAGMARCYLLNDDVEGAEGLLAGLDDKAKDHADVKSVLAAIALAQKGEENNVNTAALEEKIKSNPDDLEARYALAEALSAAGDMEGAAEHLFYSIEQDKDWNDSAARKLLLTLFEAAGASSTFAIKGRKRLSTLLFS
ncbi:MAG: thioredoxin [Robiginitomaculum sp.]|nr:thioredoxin [Robiginitomaculum sp.]MDQ7076985.1 thioredoxin [Robiginitomaculum sp.]